MVFMSTTVNWMWESMDVNTDPVKQIMDVSTILLLLMAESFLTPLRELVGWNPTLYGWWKPTASPFHVHESQRSFLHGEEGRSLEGALSLQFTNGMMAESISIENQIFFRWQTKVTQ